MISPFRGNFKVTSPYGYRTDPFTGKKSFHKGIDIVGLNNTDVHTIAYGKCEVCNEPKGFGIYVRQITDSGLVIYYAHLKTACIKSGDYVMPNTKIGVMGSTGNSTGEHTHLEFRYTGTSTTSINPYEFTYINNKKGVYTGFPEVSPYFAGCVVQDKCGLSTEGMMDMWSCNYSDIFIRSIAEKLLHLR